MEFKSAYLLKPVTAILLTVASGCVVAQWQWTDKDGRKIFSDRGPGPEVPESNILKRPAGSKSQTPPTAPVSDPAEMPAPVAKPVVPPNTGVDKTLEAKKKQAEAAEAAKQKAEEERIAKAKAENCKQARQSKAAFDSGLRISRTTASGEREFLDDAARAAEVQRIQGVIDSECK